jgi:hypothetical protein
VNIVTQIIEVGNFSQDLHFIYCWGRNAAVRGASLRQMRFCDLNITTGFGPKASAPRDKTLLLVLRKGDYHKENHQTNRQVGV